MAWCYLFRDLKYPNEAYFGQFGATGMLLFGLLRLVEQAAAGVSLT